jgi:hypothetical protein
MGQNIVLASRREVDHFDPDANDIATRDGNKREIKNG